MKVAYLILAHHQPEHLARLVHNISADWNDIYIHIDAKQDMQPFIDCIDNSDNPVFLNAGQRIKVTWGGFSITEATLSLILTAYESGREYDRFCLLSGADFPVKTLDEIKSEFFSNVEFMRIQRRLLPDENNSHSRKVHFHHFLDSESELDREQSGKIEREPYNRIKLYHGSAWWSLTRNCIDFIIDFLDSNPDYTELHRTTRCSDEIYFHSIVKASPYAENLSQDFENESVQEMLPHPNGHGCHYIDWSGAHMTSPKKLNSGDLYQVLKSGMLFARKIDAIDSSPLVTTIEKLNGDGRESSKEEKNWGKTLVAFQAHFLTQSILDEFYRIKAIADRQTVVKLFYDNTASNFDFSLFQSEDDYFLFNVTNVFDHFNMKCISGDFYENGSLPLLYYSCLNPEFQYYWLVEYDVRFSGDWKSLIDSFKSTDADLLGTTICTKDFDPGWSHWKSIESPDVGIDSIKLIKGFFPVVRYSKKACEVLIKAYHDGWKGHFEGVVPTVLNMHDCRIEDIGGNGKFTPVERRNLFYFNSPVTDDLSPGTFVYRPDMSDARVMKDTLYHPIKSDHWKLPEFN